jgi:hypothetical protein
MANVVASGVESLTLSIEDAEFEVTSFSSTWQVNAIPSCEIRVAVGYNAFTSQLAAIHSSGNSVLRRAPATVNLQMVGDQKAGKAWPGGGVIFEGYVHSIRPTRSTQGVSVNITLYHWLSDLNTSHMGFGRFSPTTMWDIFKNRPIVNSLGMSDWLFKDEATAVEIEEVYDSDLYDLFKEGLNFSLTDVEMPWFREVDGVKPEAFHEKAVAALDRLTNLGCKLTAAVAAGTSAKPLDEIAILEMMGAIAHNQAGGTTAWSKLVAFCNIFQIGIIPAVEDVYIAPLVPGAVDPGLEIGNDEIDLGGGSGFDVNLSRGVVMYPYRQLVYPLGGIPSESDGLAVQCMGQYVLKPGTMGTALEGAIDMIQAPRIFSIDFVMGGDAEGSEGTEQEEVSPDSEPPEDGTTAGDPDEAPKYVYADDWCKNYYWNYVFGRRVQLVDSRLRFDLTPGTIVKVDIAQASAGSAAGSLPGFAGNVIYGQAEKIVYSISADSNSISTKILVKYVKSEKDKELADSEGANESPLFDTVYGTSGLVKPLQNSLGA